MRHRRVMISSERASITILLSTNNNTTSFFASTLKVTSSQVGRRPIRAEGVAAACVIRSYIKGVFV